MSPIGGQPEGQQASGGRQVIESTRIIAGLLPITLFTLLTLQLTRNDVRRLESTARASWL